MFFKLSRASGIVLTPDHIFTTGLLPKKQHCPFSKNEKTTLGKLLPAILKMATLPAILKMATLMATLNRADTRQRFQSELLGFGTHLTESVCLSLLTELNDFR